MRTKKQRLIDSTRIVMTTLNGFDPYGLEPGVTSPWDEYDPEATAMAEALLARGTLTVEEVDTIWLQWFDEPLTEVLTRAEVESLVTSLDALDLPED